MSGHLPLSKEHQQEGSYDKPPSPVASTFLFPEAAATAPTLVSSSTSDAEITSVELEFFRRHQRNNRDFGAELVRDSSNGKPLLDHNSKPITVSKMLATKPLKRDLCTRPGPGNRQLTYMSGDAVTRTLNDVFGFDGWSLEVKNTNREVRKKNAMEIYIIVCSISFPPPPF